MKQSGLGPDQMFQSVALGVFERIRIKAFGGIYESLVGYRIALQYGRFSDNGKLPNATFHRSDVRDE